MITIIVDDEEDIKNGRNSEVGWFWFLQFFAIGIMM